MKKGAKHKISCMKTSRVRNRPEVGLSVRGCRQEYFTLVRCELTDSQFYSVTCFGIAGHFQWVGSLLSQNRDLRRLFCWFPGAKAPNRTHLTVSMFFLSLNRMIWGWGPLKVTASAKKFFLSLRLRWGSYGWRNKGADILAKEGSLICPQGKLRIF